MAAGSRVRRPWSTPPSATTRPSELAGGLGTATWVSAGRGNSAGNDGGGIFMAAGGSSQVTLTGSTSKRQLGWE